MFAVLGVLLGIGILIHALLTPVMPFIEGVIAGLLMSCCWRGAVGYLKEKFGKS